MVTYLVVIYGEQFPTSAALQFRFVYVIPNAVSLRNLIGPTVGIILSV